MTTRSLEGTRTYPITLAEGCSISVNVIVDSGELFLEIGREGEKPIYTGRLTESFSFRVNGASGDYTAQVRGVKFAGSYRLDWSAKEEQ